MKTKSIYKTALVRDEFPDKNKLRTVKAKRVILDSCPHRLFFAHRANNGLPNHNYYKITEALSGAVVYYDWNDMLTLKQVIEQANERINNHVPEKYKTFDEFIEDYIYRERIFPLKVNLKVFAV